MGKEAKIKLAIFDHVGNKSGLDCYDGSLTYALYKQGYETTVYSNYIGIQSNKIEYKPVYEGFSKKNRLLKLNKFIHATIISSSSSKREHVDLVILHIFSAGIVSFLLTLIPKLFHLKIAVIVHDVSSFKDDDNRYIQNLIYNWFSDFIIVHNKYSYDHMLSSIKIENTDKLHIIKHGGYLDHVNQDKTKKEKIQKKLRLDIARKYLLFFGQIKEAKGLDILLKAMPNIDQDIHLIIAGKPDKNDFSKYDRIINNMQLNDRIIKKIRFIKDDEREKLFLACDLIVLPYKLIFQSGVLLMAMSYGLPVIASNLPSNREIISHEKNGFLFKNEDINDLSIKINQYINNDKLLKNISVNSINTIKDDYSWGTIANQYIQLLKN